MIHAVATVGAHLRQTQADWNEADSTTGFDVGDGGGVRLTSTDAVKIQSTTANANELDLNKPLGDDHDVAIVVWGGTDPSDIEIREIKATLNHDTGAGQEVTDWGLQVWAVIEQLGLATDLDRGFVLTPLHEPVFVTAGSGTSEITFDLSSALPRPKLLGAPTYDGPNADRVWLAPVSLIVIWGIKADGSLAANTAWRFDTGVSEVTTSNNELSGRHVQPSSRGGGLYDVLTTDVSGTPQCKISAGGFTTATLTFTTNDFDLGAVPSTAADVEFTIEGEIPPGTSIDVEARVSAPDSWVAVLDGQTAADVGLAASQTYEKRYQLNTNAAANLTPVLRIGGVRERTLTDLSEVARVVPTSAAVDPLERRSAIAEGRLSALRPGSRDYEDAITTLFKNNDPAAIEFRIFKGHPALSREKWKHTDTWIVEDTEATGASLDVVLLSPLGLLKQQLPKDAAGARAVLAYENQTLKAVSDDLLDNQAAVPARWRGPGIEDNVTTVTKRISERTDAKDELESLAPLARGAWVASQGRLKFVDLFTPSPIRHLFRREEIRPLHVGPGLRSRVTEYVVPYNWSEQDREYALERSFVSGASLAAISKGRLAGIEAQQLPDISAQWIRTQALADVVGLDVTDTMGTGLLLWPFESLYPYPELEWGDAVALETDWFVAKDPHAARALAGRLVAVGRLVDIDTEGRRFAVWVKSYSDIFGTASAVSRALFVDDVVSAGYALFVPLTSGEHWTLQNEWAEPTSLGANEEAGAHLTRRELPQGSKVTELKGRYYLGDASAGRGRPSRPLPIRPKRTRGRRRPKPVPCRTSWIGIRTTTTSTSF
jgi:hypothetical protein